MKIAINGLRIAAALGLLAVACAGLAANFHSPYWFDEVFTGAMACQADLKSSAMLTLHDVHPPTYVLIAHALFGVFGCNLGVIRLSSLLFTAIACVFLFLTVRRSRLDWLLGAALLLGSPAFWYYTVEARSYALLFMATSGLVYFAGRGDRSGQLLGLSMALLASVVNFFGYYLFLVAAILVIRQTSKRSHRDRVVLLMAWGVAILLATVLDIFQLRFARQVLNGGMWIPKPALADLIHLPMFFYGGSPLALVVVTAIVVLLGFGAVRSRAAARGEGVILIGLFLGFVLGLFVVSYQRPMFVHRYTYFLFPLLVVGLLKLKDPPAEAPIEAGPGRKAYPLLITGLCGLLLFAECRSTLKTYAAIRPVSWQAAAEPMSCESGGCLFVLDAPALRGIDDDQYRAIANFFAPQSGHFEAVRPEAVSASAPPAGRTMLYIQSFHPVVHIEGLAAFKAHRCTDLRKRALGAVVCPL